MTGAIAAAAIEAQPAFGQIRPLKRPFGAVDDKDRGKETVAPFTHRNPSSTASGASTGPAESYPSHILDRRAATPIPAIVTLAARSKPAFRDLVATRQTGFRSTIQSAFPILAFGMALERRGFIPNRPPTR